MRFSILIFFPAALRTVILASEHWRGVYPFLLDTKTWSKTSFNLSFLICFSSTRGSVTVMWKEWSGGRYFGEILRRFFHSVIPSHCHHGFCNPQHPGEMELGGLLCTGSASTTLTFTENIKSRRSVFPCLLNACSQSFSNQNSLLKENLAFVKGLS